jgi:hypothetical protein
VDGLDGAFGRARDDLETGAEHVDRLVVKAVDIQAAAGNGVQRQADGDSDPVRRPRRRPARAVLKVDEVRQVRCVVPPRATLSVRMPR